MLERLGRKSYGVSLADVEKAISSEVSQHSEYSLDELYTMASHYGEVRIGGVWENMAEVVMDVGGDRLYIKERSSSDIKTNLSIVVKRASLIKEFYKQVL